MSTSRRKFMRDSVVATAALAAGCREEELRQAFMDYQNGVLDKT